MTKKTKPAEMNEDHLDAVVGGGHSQCEGDDGRGTGGGGSSGSSGGGRRTQNNQLTSFIDASNVY